MVGALMYLTASRPDIVHATCYCARYQAKPTKKHLTAVKRIFRCLKDTINMGLWYPNDTGFELTTFSDLDHAGCLDSRKSTSGGIQFLGGDKSNEETNAAGADTRPPMLVESDYDSWKIRIHRYIRGKPNGKLIWKSIQNGPTPHPMITNPPPTDSTIVPAPRKKLDSEFSEEENKL
ncbi:hypothetical protein Tco_1537366, partial [Tanacetum coccineum]